MTLVSTTVLHDSASQDWTNPKPFYEGERISHCVQVRKPFTCFWSYTVALLFFMATYKRALGSRSKLRSRVTLTQKLEKKIGFELELGSRSTFGFSSLAKWFIQERQKQTGRDKTTPNRLSLDVYRCGGCNRRLMWGKSKFRPAVNRKYSGCKVQIYPTLVFCYTRCRYN